MKPVDSHLCANTSCSTQGCQLWFGLRPHCGEHRDVENATVDAGSGAALLKLGTRAFAVPLAVLLTAVAWVAHGQFGQAQDWIGIGALALAGWCGWRATRSSRQDAANSSQTK